MGRKLLVYLLTAAMLFTSVDVTVLAAGTETGQSAVQPGENTGAENGSEGTAGGSAPDKAAEEESADEADAQTPDDDADNGNAGDESGKDEDGEMPGDENMTEDTADETDAQEESVLTDDVDAEEELDEVPANVYADVEGNTGKLGTNNNITWTYDAATKTLTVSGEDELRGTYEYDGTYPSYKEISPFSAICNEKNVEKIVFKNCVLLDLAEYLFAGLTELKEIDFAGIDTCNVISMTHMFSDCTGLQNLDLRNFDTSKVTNMIGMFNGCGNLTSLNLSNFDTSNVCYMIAMFAGCTSLSSLDVSNFNTSKVQSMSSMFSYCVGLQSLNVSHFDTSNVVDMALMFEQCKNLRSLDISKFVTGNVTNMSCMFRACDGLTELDLSHFDTSRVTNICGMFSSCKNLTSIDVSNFDTRNVTDMSHMFFDCFSLQSVDVSHFDTSRVTNMYMMFYNCSNLTSLDVSHFDTGRVTNMGGMFNSCKATVLDVSNFDTSNVTDMGSMFNGCDNLTSLDVSHFDTNRVTDMCLMFTCARLTELDVSNFDTSNVTNMSCMIRCRSLTDLDVSHFDTSHVTNMYGMFEDCKQLTSLDVSNFDTSNVTNMSRMFDGCESLVSLDVSYFDTSNVTNMDSMFSNCKSLVSLDMSSFDTRNVTDMEGMFVDSYYGPCDSLTTLYTPKTMGGVTAELPATFYDASDNAYTILSADNTGKLLTTFKQSDAYRIHFDGNGADGSMPDQCIEVNVEKALTANTFKKPGYRFTGWNTKADNSGTPYADKASVKNLAAAKGTITLYAQWKAVNYTIRFNGNGATEGSLEDMTGCVGGEKYTLPENPFKRQGYTFAGWNTKAGGSGVSYADKAEVQNLCSTEGGIAVLYAQWKSKGSDPVTPDVYYSVQFVMNGHGTQIAVQSIKAGEKVNRPQDPIAVGYKFLGWYREAAFTTPWDFAADTVTGSMSLYAKWQASTSGIEIAEIPDVVYTGVAQKPNIAIYDGETLLKAGTDYTVTYKNNINVNEKKKSGDVDLALPYVQVTGKGNYTGTSLYLNFNIVPVPIEGEDEQPASGITFKYNDQNETSTKAATDPLTSIKYKKNLVKGMDYTTTLTAVSASGADGTSYAAGAEMADAKVPKGASGEFLLTVQGKGNYSGSLTRSIYVTDKPHLMKNVSITLGKNCKSKEYNAEGARLQSAWYDAAAKKYYKVSAGAVTGEELQAADVFIVKAGNVCLAEGKDFTVSYENNAAVGTATLVISGMGAYAGSKSVAFKVTGTALTAKNVETAPGSWKDNLPYTGSQIRQDDVSLSLQLADGTKKPLQLGKDYELQYKANINQGKATVTVLGLASGGYTGKFTKTFKIDKVALADSMKAPAMADIRVPYEKSGVLPASQVLLTDANGNVLKEKTDYSVSFKNNKAVAYAGAITEDSRKPCMIITGKGNYTGTLQVYFSITEKQMDDGAGAPAPNISVEAATVAFNGKKAESYEYKPAVTVKDGKAKLAAGKDYEVKYHNNTQAAYKEYLAAVKAGSDTTGLCPYAEITAKSGGSYTTLSPVKIDLPVYETAFSGNNLYVLVSGDAAEVTYTGGQSKPGVSVYYGSADAVKKAKNGKVTDDAELTGTCGLKRLTEDTDYRLSYGANKVAGSKKGSVTVEGISPLYGKSITVKFDILKKVLE